MRTSSRLMRMRPAPRIMRQLSITAARPAMQPASGCMHCTCSPLPHTSLMAARLPLCAGAGAQMSARALHRGMRPWPSGRAAGSPAGAPARQLREEPARPPAHPPSHPHLERLAEARVALQQQRLRHHGTLTTQPAKPHPPTWNAL